MDILRSYLVPPEKLKNQVYFGNFSFETTEELLSNGTIIGQDRAVKSMDFGLQIKREGYNIFMTGLSGTGKTSHAKLSLEELSKTEEPPADICFVHNFSDSSKPLKIEFEAGRAKEFKEDMKDFIKKLKEEIEAFLSAESYQAKLEEINSKYKERRSNLIKELKEYAAANNYSLKSTDSGYITLPLVNGKGITNEEFELLDESTQHEIEVNSEKMQQVAIEVLKKIEENEIDVEEKLIDLQDKISFSLVRYFICCLQTKYSTNQKACSYLDEIQKDIMKNISIFLPEDDNVQSDDDDLISQVEDIKEIQKKAENELLFKRYQVNLFIDNSHLKGSPVIFELNPTFQNLLGKLEYDNNRGSLTTNFMKIKAGAIHKANGGYLVLNAQDVLTNPFAWQALKRTLKCQKIYIEDIMEQAGSAAISNLNPQPIDLNIKIILLGSPYIYDLLLRQDEDFQKLFKIKVAFDYEMINNEKNISKMAYFISHHCNKENLRHFNYEAVIKIIEHSNRIAGSQEKLTTRFNELLEIIYEADTYAKIDNSEYVLEKHAQEAITQKKYRHNLYEEKTYEQIEKGKLLISVEGTKVGEINGLSILDTGDYIIGKPSKITATTYMGRSGIVNIERETNLSGNIHDKGLMILKGYLGEQFAQDYPLSLSAKICFEQLYGGIDGDSASSTELYALLSSLSNVPINQAIAVTGSINQKGEIQSVGGVTEKIEGFYDICKLKSFTGKQGVIIPRKNIVDLVLRDEVIEDVKNGQFFIYAIDKVEEGIEILMNLKAGEKNKSGQFPEDTVYYKIQKRLEKNRKEALRFSQRD